MIDPVEVASRVQHVRSAIASAGGTHVQLIAVTKTFGNDAIDAAFSAGCDAIGENYIQELQAKIKFGLPDIPVHFIGTIQSNKVKHVASSVSLWHTVDRQSAIGEIAKRSPGAAILLQVNTTSEPTKGGVVPAEVDTLRTYATEAGLSVRGLMTIGPTNGSVSEQETAFRMLKRLADEQHLAECSMGMSDDFEVAVACGSTMVRIGSRLFGARPPK